MTIIYTFYNFALIAFSQDPEEFSYKGKIYNYSRKQQLTESGGSLRNEWEGLEK